MSARTHVVTAMALLFAACAVEEGIRPAGTRRSSAEAQRTFGTALPGDLRAQAEEALARDAWRREHRFLDAAEPGHLFAATRIDEAEIEAGAWPSEDLFQIGAQLFHFTFTREVGFGARDLPAMARFHTGLRGGPDAAKCAACHWRGGPAGGGDGADAAYLQGDGDRQSSALARNPIALSGAGFIEILAAEMNAEIAAERDALAAKAKQQGKPAEGAIKAKGISFGSITVKPDGSIATGGVEGIDGDLVIKPFGWKGNVATLRDAVEDALLLHHGMESTYLVKTAPKDRVGPFGGADPDGDGVIEEITEGQVTALTLFVAMQELPQIVAPPDSNLALLWADGRNRFESLGCAACHTPSLPLGRARFDLPSREGGATVSIDLASEAAEPRIAGAMSDGVMRAHLYSDLKRHDLGDALAEPRADRGVGGRLFLTRPLWGVGRSGPYLHDGRAATLEAAILAHGGEAQKSRDAYAALDDPKRGSVRVFLASLTRARRLVAQ